LGLPITLPQRIGSRKCHMVYAQPHLTNMHAWLRHWAGARQKKAGAELVRCCFGRWK